MVIESEVGSGVPCHHRLAHQRVGSGESEAEEPVDHLHPAEGDHLPEESVCTVWVQDTDTGVAKGIFIVARWIVPAERRRPSDLCP